MNTGFLLTQADLFDLYFQLEIGTASKFFIQHFLKLFCSNISNIHIDSLTIS